MSNRPMIKMYYISILLLIFPLGIQAQSIDELMQRAYLHYTEKQYDLAKVDIDEAVANRKGIENPMAWHIRGFVYKDMFINKDSMNRYSESRDIAVQSLQRSIFLDGEGKFYEMNQLALKYLATSYWNNASEIINSPNIHTVGEATEYFEKFRAVYDQLNPDSSFVKRDVDFYLALATGNRRIYESDRSANEDYWLQSNNYLKKVLELDPQNFDANYSLGVSYYNKGAHSLEKLPEIEIFDLYRVQGESIRSIQGALPFMIKAYEINPDRIEAIKGLKWIHFNLHQYEESDKYNQQLNTLEK